LQLVHGDLRVLECAQEPQVGGLMAGDGAALRDERPAEEKALEVRATAADGVVELVQGLDTLRDDGGPAVSGDGYLPAGIGKFADVYFHEAGKRHEVSGPFGRDVVIDRESVARALQLGAGVDDIAIGFDVCCKFQHDASCRKYGRDAFEQQPPADTHERPSASRKRLE